jgi:putative transposase
MSQPDLRSRGSRALRRGRASFEGQVYLVTFATWERERWFARDDAARAACRAGTDPRLWNRSRCLAWVLRPDHWHGLIELGPGDELSKRVGLLKANVARSARIALGSSAGTIWARGFHDHALRREASLLDAARYLVMNPVRARITDSVWKYPYWDAVWIGEGVCERRRPGSLAAEF